MQKPSQVFFLSVFFSFVFNAFAFDAFLQFKILTSDQGLSHPYVRGIVQDNLGFMWFGTFDGLNRYDGHTFTVYKHNDLDTTSLPSSIIRCLYKDKKGNLWIGTAKGLCRYDAFRDCFIRYKDPYVGLGEFDINSIYEDHQGCLWVGSLEHGLFQSDSTKTKWKQYLHQENDPKSIGSNHVRTIFEDSRGRLWISTVGSGVAIFDRKKQAFVAFRHRKSDPHSLAGDEVFDIVEDRQGYLWFACYGAGLSCIHVDQATHSIFINYYPKLHGLCDNSIRTLCPDRNGGLWIGTENGGLDFLNEDRKTFYHYENELGNPKSLSNNSIYAIYQDRVGDLWIGTYAGGVNVIHHTQQAFKHYQYYPGNSNTLNNNYVWEFQEDVQGNIWIATDGGGLNRWNPRTGQFSHYTSRNTNLNKDAVLTVFIDSQNDIWVGTWGGGFSRFDPNTRVFFPFTMQNSGLSNNNVFDIAEFPPGVLWLATQKGLNRFDKNSRSFRVYTAKSHGLPSDQIEVLCVDHSGKILLGTVYGFGIFDPKTETCLNYFHDPKNPNTLSENFVTSIFEEDSSTLWIGTTHGLNRLDRTTNQMTRYFTSNGLSDDLIFGIEKDNRGYLWISTNKGLTRWHPRTHHFNHYTKEDGLQGNTFIKKSHYRARDGKLYFGGVNGFNVFDPEAIVENPIIPPIVITDFQIFNKPVKIGKDSPLKQHITQTKTLELSYKHKVFSFQFAALNFVASSKNQYAYRLEGFDPDWNYVGTQRSATYTNIPPGRYVFRVKGSNNDNIWNEEGASIQIIITPPFWKTWWFRIVITVFCLGLLLGFYEWRIYISRKQKAVLQALVDQQTEALRQANEELEAFTYSVSHDLRAPLRGMDGFSEALLEDYGNQLDEKAKDYLQRIRKNSQKMGQLIDALLKLSRWTRVEMHLKKIDLGQLVENIVEEFRQKNPSRKIEFIGTKPVWVEGDEALLRVMVENLVDNAWKFTANKENPKIEFGVIQDKNQRIFFIKDNGIGFDMQYQNKLFEPFQRLHPQLEGTGIGLTTVKRIIRRHGGKIWAEGKPNEGATFYFTLGEKSLLME